MDNEMWYWLEYRISHLVFIFVGPKLERNFEKILFCVNACPSSIPFFFYYN